MVSNPDSGLFISEDLVDYEAELEERDYYIQHNVFWMPQQARWAKLRAQAKQPDKGQGDIRLSKGDGSLETTCIPF